jgi:hypothetical protein
VLVSIQVAETAPKVVEDVSVVLLDCQSQGQSLVLGIFQVDENQSGVNVLQLSLLVQDFVLR